jgi:hypothetical protein
MQIIKQKAKYLLKYGCDHDQHKDEQGTKMKIEDTR